MRSFSQRLESVIPLRRDQCTLTRFRQVQEGIVPSQVLPLILIHEESSAIVSLVIVTQAFTPDHFHLSQKRKEGWFLVVVRLRTNQ